MTMPAREALDRLRVVVLDLTVLDQFGLAPIGAPIPARGRGSLKSKEQPHAIARPGSLLGNFLGKYFHASKKR
jgi:hypothetical protein